MSSSVRIQDFPKVGRQASGTSTFGRNRIKGVNLRSEKKTDMKSKNILFLKCQLPPWIKQCVWSEIADSCAQGYYWAARILDFPGGRVDNPRGWCANLLFGNFFAENAWNRNKINWTERCNPRGFATAEYQTHGTWILSLAFPELPLLAVHADLRGQPATTIDPVFF